MIQKMEIIRQSIRYTLSYFYVLLRSLIRKGVLYVWFFDCIIIRGAYERTGGIQYTGDKDVGDLGSECIRTVYGAACLPGGMVCHG